MPEPRPLTFLCITTYEKGQEFMRECKRAGCRVLLLTAEKLRNADWPRESLDDTFYLPEEIPLADIVQAVTHLARTQKIDRIVALDEYDMEAAATLREHLRVPGMGLTTMRYFRDKLAMRMKAIEAGLTVPEFVHLLNDDKVRQFTERVPPPWVLKPRMLAGAMGIKIVHSADELRQFDASLGDQRSFYLVERFVGGDVCHVDSIVYENEVVFSVASQYGYPPIDTSHKGGIFTTRLLERGSEEEQALLAKNRRVLAGMGLLRGVSHTEFIRGHDGDLYFLETSARVGGAHIAELVESATGINLWAEWAKVEIAAGEQPYRSPQPNIDYAALLVSLARQEWPDTSGYNAPEIAWRMNKRHHVGMIVKSPRIERVRELLDQYVDRVRHDFYSSEPPREKPTD